MTPQVSEQEQMRLQGSLDTRDRKRRARELDTSMGYLAMLPLKIMTKGAEDIGLRTAQMFMCC